MVHLGGAGWTWMDLDGPWPKVSGGGGITPGGLQSTGQWVAGAVQLEIWVLPKLGMSSKGNHPQMALFQIFQLWLGRKRSGVALFQLFSRYIVKSSVCFLILLISSCLN